MVTWRDMEKGRKFWCYWKSKVLWCTGKSWRGAYIFSDADGRLVQIPAKDVSRLEVC